MLESVVIVGAGQAAAQLIASLVTAYTGIFILFNGNIGNNNN